MKEGNLGLNDFALLDAADTHLGAFNRSVDVDLDTLKVGIKTAECLSENFRTGTTCPFNLTAALVFITRLGLFFAIFTNFCHD